MTNDRGGVGTHRIRPEDASSHTGTLRQLADRFVELVRELPSIRQVRLDEVSAEPCIWTLIEVAASVDEQRNRVYDAELEASKAYPDVVLDFRLVNVAEYPSTPIEHLVPAHARVLLEL